MTRTSLVVLSLLIVQIPPRAEAQATYSCGFGITNANFGAVDILAGGAADTTAEITGSCQNQALTDVRVRICPGLNSGSGGASSGLREMHNTNLESFQYNFYQDPARSIPWGSAQQPALGGVPAIDIVIPAGGSTSFSATIYGRVLGGQQGVSPGTYTSAFPAAETYFTHSDYQSLPPDCSTHTQHLTPTPSFMVQATVLPNCQVTAQNIDFGNHGVLDSAVDGTGGLSITCTSGTSYNVALNNGLSGTSPVDRRMTLGNQSVSYGLYMDPARTQPWGSSVSQQLSGTGSSSAQNVPVYGRVPAQPTPPPGTYTDTVVVTVTY